MDIQGSIIAISAASVPIMLAQWSSAHAYQSMPDSVPNVVWDGSATWGESEFREQLQTFPVRLFIPPPITESEMERYRRLVKASSPQTNYFQVFYTRYLNNHKECCNEGFSKVRESVTKISEPVSSLDDWSWARLAAFQLNMDTIKVFKGQLAQLDSRFIAEIESVLSVEQREHLKRISNDRIRVRCLENGQPILAAKLDLVLMVEDLNLPKETLEGLNRTLEEYEVEAIPKLVALSEELHFGRIRGQQLIVNSLYDEDGRRLNPSSEEYVRRREILREQRRQNLAKRAELQMEVWRVNKEFIFRIADSLPKKYGHSLRSKFQRLVYKPDVYPDLCDPHTLFESILDTIGRDSPEAKVIEIQWAEYESRYNKLCMLMETEFEKHTFLRWISPNVEFSSPHVEKCHGLWFDRRTLTQEFATKVLASVPQNKLHDLEDQYQVFEKRCERVSKFYQQRVVGH